jgi:hypothetical protein
LRPSVFTQGLNREELWIDVSYQGRRVGQILFILANPDGDDRSQPFGLRVNLSGQGVIPVTDGDGGINSTQMTNEVNSILAHARHLAYAEWPELVVDN